MDGEEPSGGESTAVTVPRSTVGLATTSSLVNNAKQDSTSTSWHGHVPTAAFLLFKTCTTLPNVPIERRNRGMDGEGTSEEEITAVTVLRSMVGLAMASMLANDARRGH